MFSDIMGRAHASNPRWSVAFVLQKNRAALDKQDG
jgi:hypothetical protein